MATPTCVQYTLTNSNENFETGNAFKFSLPNPTLAGNCIVLFLTYAYSASRTVTVTDDQGNTWPSLTVKVDDTGAALTSSVFVLPNAATGTRTLTVTFNAALEAFTACVSEWYNVATSSVTDGSAATSAVGSSIASGSFSTTVDGDVILHYAIDTGWGHQYDAGRYSAITTLTKSSGYTILAANKWYATFLEYFVQSTHGATNPAASVSGGTGAGDSFNSITIALKSASAGTAPGTTTARVFGIAHQAVSSVAGGTANYPIWTPFAGNLGLIVTTYPESGLPMNSGTGSVNGSFARIPITLSSSPQALYKKNMTPSDTETVTLSLTGGSSGKLQYHVYDVMNAGDLDAWAEVGLGGFSAGPIPHCPDITPGISNGITIGIAEFGTGPPSAVTSPSGALFDCGFYTGYTDLSPWDSGDANGHLYFTSNAAQNWTWTDTQATGNANGLALTFADGGGGGGGGSPGNVMGQGCA